MRTRGPKDSNRGGGTRRPRKAAAPKDEVEAALPVQMASTHTAAMAVLGLRVGSGSLAKDLIYELERDFEINIEWLPYTLDIPSYLGSARLDERGEIIESNRNGPQWRRVRYSYMDCRRQARKRALVILGTRKIWDSSLAAIGMLWARQTPVSRLSRSCL
jgi:hypothetical protein